MRRVVVLLLALAMLPLPAAAGETDDSDNPSTAALSHKGQIGITLALGSGYRGIFPYDEGEFCGDKNAMGDNDDLCIGRSPFAVDLAVSYGVSQKLELLLELRFGLEGDFGASTSTDDRPNLLIFAPGVKLYIRDVGVTKFFSTLQLFIDNTRYPTNDTTDFGVKQTNGLQLDLHKTAGIYVFFGEVVTARRWLRFAMEAGLGIQARFP